MLSKDAIARGYNRRNYVVGAPTTPGWAAQAAPAADHPASEGPACGLQHEPVAVPEAVLAALRAACDRVQTERADIVAGTRDWWARTMVAETSGNPATPQAVIAHASTVEQVQAVMRIAAAQGQGRARDVAAPGRDGDGNGVRVGIVLDLCELNRFIAMDEQSQIVEVEAGMFGDVFEETIQRRHGMTMGHWPSSFGISTVGGWVACRGAGQLSTRYGKIEDMVHGMDVVLADGRLVTVGGYARAAIGPDLQQLFIGSEGTLGVIVRIRFKLHRLPDHGRAIAYGFASFAQGLEACRQILQQGANPAALRLYDALESGVQFGRSDLNVLLIADEGAPEIVDAVMAICERVCAPLGERLDGAATLERWLDTRYLTGKSAEGFKKGPGFVADTLEMCGPWKDLPAIYEEVVAALQAIPGTLAGSAHQSHAYVDGACLYFSLRGEVAVDQRAQWYRAAWDAANAVLLRHGATLSHHHGVGLLRAPYMRQSLGPAFALLEATKRMLDPKNLLNPGKLGLDL